MMMNPCRGASSSKNCPENLTAISDDVTVDLRLRYPSSASKLGLEEKKMSLTNRLQSTTQRHRIASHRTAPHHLPTLAIMIATW